jgi:hypothetical protein
VWDDAKALWILATGGTLDDFHPSSAWGAHSKARIQAGATGGQVLVEAGPGAALNAGTLGFAGTIQGLIHYGQTGDATAWRQSAGGQFVYAVWVYTGSRLWSSPETPGATTVSRWGRPGLETGDWVMEGSANLWNNIWSGKWDPFPWNQYAPYGSGQQFVVPPSMLE